jgi:hypothetical protein
VYTQDGDYIKDIEVNDLRNRYTLTKGSTQKMVNTHSLPCGPLMHPDPTPPPASSHAMGLYHTFEQCTRLTCSVEQPTAAATIDIS